MAERIEDGENLERSLKSLAKNVKRTETALDTKLTKGQRKEVKRNLQDPVKADAAMQRASADPEKSKLSDVFTLAAIQLVPVALGGILGEAVAGAEGAAAGAAGAQTGMRTAQELALKQQELDLRRKATLGQKDLTPFQRESLRLREAELEMQHVAEGRRERGLGLRFEEFGVKKEKLAQLSDKQVDNLKALQEVEAGLERAESLKGQVNTGPMAGRAQSAAELAGAADVDFTKLKTETSSLLANYVKAISGAQVSDKEARRLMTVVPNVNDDDKVFNAKLQQFRTIVLSNKSELADAIATGQKLKQETIDGMMRQVDAMEQAPMQKHPRAGQVIRQKSTGQTFMVRDDGSLQPIR